MKIAMNKDEWYKLAYKTLEDNDIKSVDGILYSGDTPLEQIDIINYSMTMFALPEEKYHKWANDAMERAELKSCHLSPMHVSKMYQFYSEMMTEKCKKNIIDYLARIRDEFVGDEMDFVGVNDNFPMAATYASAMMYWLLKDEKMLEEAYRRLRQVKKLLKRRGVISEYNSPSYTPFQLYILSHLEDIIPDEEYRIIVRNVINRICADLLAHFNPSCGMLCGPHSRQYLERNSVEGTNAFISNLFKPEVRLEPTGLGEGGDCVHCMAEFECDDRIVNLLHNREYPFEFKATAECSASNDATPEALENIRKNDGEVYIYPAGEEKLYTYMTEYYSVGTATKEWHSGIQTAGFTANYKRCKNPKSAGDIRSINCRYLLNDETVEDQKFFEQGRKTAFGNKNRALVLYKPKVAAPSAVHTMSGNLAAHYRRQEIAGNLGVTSAKTVLFFQHHSTMPDAIYVNDKRIDGFEAKFDSPQSVYIKDGDVYMAIHPLEITDLGRECAMTVCVREDKLEIAFYNYSGEQRDFSRHTFLHTQNGFGFVISSVAESGSFEEFMSEEKKTVISDRMIMSMHSRETYIRSVEMDNAQMKLAAEISVVSEGIKFITCNDYPIEIPKLYISGFDTDALPYMKD